MRITKKWTKRSAILVLAETIFVIRDEYRLHILYACCAISFFIIYRGEAQKSIAYDNWTRRRIYSKKTACSKFICMQMKKKKKKHV